MQNVCCQKWRLSANIPSKVFNSFFQAIIHQILPMMNFEFLNITLFFTMLLLQKIPNWYYKFIQKIKLSNKNPEFYSVFGSPGFYFFFLFCCLNSLLGFLCNLFLFYFFWWWQKYYWCHLSRVMMCNRQILNFSRAFYCSFVVFYGIGNTLTNKQTIQQQKTLWLNNLASNNNFLINIYKVIDTFSGPKKQNTYFFCIVCAFVVSFLFFCRIKDIKLLNSTDIWSATRI